MARELGVKLVALVANKITSPGQLDVIRQQLQLPMLTSLDYSPSVQQADLERKSVYQSDPNVVTRLTEAKQSLLSLLETDRSED
jgi:CO dehydrogenase nickel-insertion accessory protein CooC1